MKNFISLTISLLFSIYATAQTTSGTTTHSNQGTSPAIEAIAAANSKLNMADYANPKTKELNISVNTENEIKFINYATINQNIIEVASIELTTTQSDAIDVNELKTGTYFVHIRFTRPKKDIDNENNIGA